MQWDGAPVARLRPGASLLRRMVEVLDSEFLDGPQRERMRQRLAVYHRRPGRTRVRRRCARVEAGSMRRRVARPVAPAGGGRRRGAGATEATIPPPVRAAEGARRARRPFRAVHAGLLKPRAAALRALLWAIQHRVPTPALPAPGLVSLPADKAHAACRMGWVPAGPSCSAGHGRTRRRRTCLAHPRAPRGAAGRARARLGLRRTCCRRCCARLACA